MKFEYSDFYKFITSLGIALVSLAMIIPWLFLKEPFDLFTKQSDLSLLTPLAQEILSQRQSLILFFLRIVPWFSCISFVLGFVATLGGGIMWFRRTQKYLDRINELNVKVLEKQLIPQSAAQVNVQREEDAAAQLVDAELEVSDFDIAKLPETNEVKSMADGAFRIEKRLTDLVESCFEDSHIVFANRQLGPVSLDLIMASWNNKHKDRIFEIKYIRKGFKYNWLRDNLYKVIYANLAYEKETNRESIPHLFIVHSGTLSTVIESYRTRIQSEIDTLKTEVGLSIISESDFYNIGCSELKTLLEIN